MRQWRAPMRSAAEIRFRLRQEIANAFLLMRPPSASIEATAPLPAFANPAEAARSVEGTQLESDMIGLAGRILSGQLPVLGTAIDTGPRIAWRRDYERLIETPPAYFRRIPYLDVARAGDHKFIWELSRHQHLVLVSQASLITGDERYRQYVFDQLEHWWSENPFQCGINWTSALEVAFRALSWIWIYHLIGVTMPAGLRTRFLTELARHGYHLEYNLSIYFSPNTHLLGEAVALHALGALFPQFSRAAKWRETGRSIVLRELERQIQPDGSHFEQSTYYHVYALDFFLLDHVIEPMPESAIVRMRSMADFLAAITDGDGVLPFIGDDDGGRLFHPFGPRNRFARATLATSSVLFGQRYFQYQPADLLEQAVWWIGPESLKAVPAIVSRQQSRLFPQSGLAAMVASDTHVIVDCGGFGVGNAGHSHSDALSIVMRYGGEEILIDPGTYTYVGDPQARDEFRGAGAHNTIRVDGHDQADAAGPFRWLNKPRVEINEWCSTETADYLDAACFYRGIRHRRQVWFTKPDLLVLLDTLEGPGEHDIEQFWHAGEAVVSIDPERWRIGRTAELATSNPGVVIAGWRSDALGSKRPTQVIRIRLRATLPTRMATGIRIGGEAPKPVISGDRLLVGRSVYPK